ncbi:MAG: tRNA (adenosine(37)-N6)-dimethylallyltransferase MiaA [Gemmataceae bacterium]
MPAHPADFRDAIILTGPTGSGKSTLALGLAEYLNAEIIACDSMTLYRGMNIGTAKPSAADRARVPHHLVDVIDPWESVSVAWWLDRAADAVRDITGRRKVPLIVGGTPFYLKALLFGLFEGPPADHKLREQLEADAAMHGPEALHARLVEVDPVVGAKLHPNDVRRVVRALEVFQLTGKPMSEWQTQWSTAPLSPPFQGGVGEGGSEPPTLLGDPPLPLPKREGIRDRNQTAIYCLDIAREVLYERINRRVEIMVEAGWLDEVRQLRSLPQPLSREASQALGYPEMAAVLDRKMKIEDAVALVQQKTRQFAKRQFTWFRHLPGLQMVSPELTFTEWRLRIQ